jgi:hypothetical protein
MDKYDNQDMITGATPYESVGKQIINDLNSKIS